MVFQVPFSAFFFFFHVCGFLKHQQPKNGDYKRYFSIASMFLLPCFLKQDFVKRPEQNQAPDRAVLFFMIC